MGFVLAIYQCCLQERRKDLGCNNYWLLNSLLLLVASIPALNCMSYDRFEEKYNTVEGISKANKNSLSSNPYS